MPASRRHSLLMLAPLSTWSLFPSPFMKHRRLAIYFFAGLTISPLNRRLPGRDTTFFEQVWDERQEQQGQLLTDQDFITELEQTLREAEGLALAERKVAAGLERRL
ncbi:hypothetical protein [Thermogemmatispora tikiterensis]|uniref:Uncharacterized protein n=1 Tax=Thermogemmatispora tikiterensis TaxID=1825093 RepID=A0A328VQA4_9CHLR|nr:hypothetical protein [Thermogemmatispora tikiterensis]RAQ98382.1 hypothetical protein A4R35_22770 [Thermogemmatispora tikiterensis]